jgi:4-hydroxyacetophenone monooxygenase
MPRVLRPAPAPITEDDAFIARALERASVPTLMMSLVHLTGDVELLRGTIRPAPAMPGDVQGGMSDEDKAAVRSLALAALCAYRDSGELPPPPSPDTIREMMSFLVGQEVPAEYVPMMLEELALDGKDARDVEWRDVPVSARRRFRVLVIGAGMSGLLAAIRLEDAGIPYTVVEKNAGVGGTWYENTYPGCRVDIANHFYCYSFEPNPGWTEFFSRRDELHDYFERCATDYGVRKHIRFRTEVVAARFDETSNDWEVRLRGPEGAEENVHCNAIISAVGQLNRPRIPPFDGLERFEGAAFHSAAWDHGQDLAGKRVAVIGTGASAFQLVPEVAKEAARVCVFQRSPAWMAPNPNYHSRVSDEKRWVLEHVPYYGRWYRFLLFWPGSDGLWPSLVVDPEWPHQDRSINAANEATRVFFTETMKEQVGDDPELLEKVVPRYPPFGKRMLQDNGSWLAALKRENVDLVTDGIDHIAPKGIVDARGELHPADVIVFATGFHANRWLWPIEVTGRGGVVLADQWGEDPRAYLGITAPAFPNLFLLYGPGTNLAHAGSIIFHSECQVRYVMGCLAALLRGGHASMECREEVCGAFNRRLDEMHSRMVWSHPGMDSWYKNSKGRVTTTSPWKLVDYWRWTRRPDLADFELR